MRKKLKIILWVVAAVVLSLFAAKRIADFQYFHGYDPSLPFHATVQPREQVNDVQDVFGLKRPRHYQRFKVTFDSRPGEAVPTLITLPPEYAGPLPVIILLHGMGQDKEFLDEIAAPFNEAGFAMASFDQYTRGERRIEAGPLGQAIAFRQRPAKTINDTRRLIDYLQTCPEIDPERIYLIGASFGAITGCSAVAFDKRIKAAVLVVGGGNLSVLLDAPFIRKELSYPLHLVAKPLVCSLVRPADPIRYAAQTSPTPLLFLNGDCDTLVTPAAAKELFQVAGEPKEIRWYPCDHPGLRDQDNPIVLQMLDEALEWLREKDAPFRQVPAAADETATKDAA